MSLSLEAAWTVQSTAPQAGSGAAPALFLVAVFSTFFCTAINAYTLRLAYPLWRHVQSDSFKTLHAAYLRLLGPVITFPHIVMFFSTAALLWRRPAACTLAEASVVFALAATVVLLSAVIGGAVHGRFSRTGLRDEPGMQQLILLSWSRTLLLLAASWILCRILWTTLRV